MSDFNTRMQAFEASMSKLVISEFEAWRQTPDLSEEDLNLAFMGMLLTLTLNQAAIIAKARPEMRGSLLDALGKHLREAVDASVLLEQENTGALN